MRKLILAWSLRHKFETTRSFILPLLCMCLLSLAFGDVGQAVFFGLFQGLVIALAMTDLSLSHPRPEYGHDVSYLLSRPLTRSSVLSGRILAHLVFFLSILIPILICSIVVLRFTGVGEGSNDLDSLFTTSCVLYLVMMITTLWMAPTRPFAPDKVSTLSGSLRMTWAFVPVGIVLGLFGARGTLWHYIDNGPVQILAWVGISSCIVAFLGMSLMTYRRWQRWDLRD